MEGHFYFGQPDQACRYQFGPSQSRSAGPLTFFWRSSRGMQWQRIDDDNQDNARGSVSLASHEISRQVRAIRPEFLAFQFLWSRLLSLMYSIFLLTWWLLNVVTFFPPVKLNYRRRNFTKRTKKPSLFTYFWILTVHNVFFICVFVGGISSAFSKENIF
jgi:hypothetical protein